MSASMANLKVKGKAASALKTITLWCADFFLPMPHARQHENDEVAFIRLDGIGDFVLWLPFAPALRQHYGDRPVVLIANTSWASLARAFPYWDEVWAVDPGRMERDLRYRRQTLSAMRTRNFSSVVQPTFSRNARTGDPLVRASKAAQRLGFAGDSANTNAALKHLTDCWYTQLVPSRPGTMSEIHRNQEFLHGLGITTQPQCPQIPWPAPSVANASPYFIVFPGASWEGKRWPSSHFTALADRVALASGWRCVIAGGEADKSAAARIATTCAMPSTDLTGGTSLEDFMGLLAGARLVVANDTSAVHMAALVGTPCIAIVGGGHFGRFAPYPAVEHIATSPVTVHAAMTCFGCNWDCVHPRAPGQPARCVHDVSVDMVWKAVLALNLFADKKARH
jgi:ADP-heptose:LPS heptosyltransferase